MIDKADESKHSADEGNSDSNTGKEMFSELFSDNQGADNSGNTSSKPAFYQTVSTNSYEILDPNYEARLNELLTILDISNLVGSVMELDDILDSITKMAARHLKVDVCSIYLINEEGDYVVLKATSGLNPKIVGRAKMKIGEGIPGLVVKTGDPIMIKDCHIDPRHKPLAESNEDPCHAFFCLPLRIQEEVIGAITARKHEIYEFSIAERTMFETIAKQVAIVIEKSRLYFSKISAERLAGIAISLSEIAHYIKNLLQLMKGGAYFVETGLSRGDIEKAREGWKILKKSNKKIAYLVENMLNYSRPVRPNLDPVNINDLIIEILHSIEETAYEREIEIKPHLNPRIPPTLIDHQRIYDVVLNLVSNAFDAIPDGQQGVVGISSWFDAEREKACISIEDNGSGIPEDVLPRIFNLFFSTKGSKGTGIGLAVSKKIVEEHGGEIKVESEIGKGTKFIVELPVNEIN